MGFLDSIQGAMNRSTAAAGRGVDKMKLNNRISEIQKQRQALLGQLGASLYEQTKTDPVLRAGREALYDGIDALDVERAQCLAEIARIEEEARAAEVAAATLRCTQCGSVVYGTDMFCSTCGKRVDEIRAELAAASTQYAPAASGLACTNCGNPVGEDDMFCSSCGKRVDEIKAELAAQAAPVAEGPKCPTCGAAITEGDMFCMGCGTKLGE